MSTKDFVRMVSPLALSFLLDVPKELLKKAGLGCKRRFELEDLVIERPEEFDSIAHKNAFDSIGTYLTTFGTPDLMVCYQESSLKDPNSPLPSGVPLEVWHQALEYFAEKDAIGHRWDLKIPYFSPRNNKVLLRETPKHDVDGCPLDTCSRRTYFGDGRIPADDSFRPWFLTDEQKAGLIGVGYAVCIFYYVNGEVPRHVVSESDFEKVFYRKRRVLTINDRRK